VLAKQRRVSLQSMSELVQVLVERGWIERTPDPNDRRQSLLHITEHGRKHYQRAQLQTLQRLMPLIADLDAAERAALSQALPALRRVLALEESKEIHGR
jgi:DNA-binding MarR family transcriptional regulator